MRQNPRTNAQTAPRSSRESVMHESAANDGPLAYAGPVIYALTIHADYKCQRSGVCCTSDWDVPVEVPLYRTLRDVLDSGRLRPEASGACGEGPLWVEDDMPDGAAAVSYTH